MFLKRSLTILLVVGFCSCASAAGVAAQALDPVSDQGAGQALTDLDRLMNRALAGRDGDWKKLQQYILDEQERIEIRGPGKAPIWGEDREFMWFLRDGYFVRSPLRIGGVAVSEGDRRDYEARYLERTVERDQRLADCRAEAGDATAVVEIGSVDGLIMQSREPQFAAAGDLLRFKFEPGHYAFVGREPGRDALDGVTLLRIEYYPTRLLESEPEDELECGGRLRRRDVNPGYDAAARTLLNKVSRVTFWVDPDRERIVRYAFENVSLDFIPASWLIRIDEVVATLEMVEAFPDVWLPGHLAAGVSMELAVGRFDVRYDLRYDNYREADVSSTIRPGGQPLLNEPR